MLYILRVLDIENNYNYINLGFDTNEELQAAKEIIDNFNSEWDENQDEDESRFTGSYEDDLRNELKKYQLNEKIVFVETLLIK